MFDVGVKEPKTDEYLGDGVYASFDGFQIKLWTQRDGGEKAIYLDLDTYRAVRAYGAKIWELRP